MVALQSSEIAGAWQDSLDTEEDTVPEPLPAERANAQPALDAIRTLRERLSKEAKNWQRQKARRDEHRAKRPTSIRYEDEIFRDKIKKHVIIATRSLFDTLDSDTQVYGSRSLQRWMSYSLDTPSQGVQ